MSTPLKPLKWYRKLATKRGRLEAGAFIVEGARSINQIASNHPDEIIEIVATEDPSPDYSDYAVRLGVMAVVRVPVDIWSDRLPGDIGNKVLLLEDIQDPGNVGTLIRTAAALNFSGAIMSENCADPLSPKCVQATAGAVLSVWLRRTTNYIELISALKKDGYTIAATDLNGTEEPELLSYQSKLLLALGNEAAGLSIAMLNAADYRLRIPTIRGKAESLNVAACGAICMYLGSRKS